MAEDSIPSGRRLPITPVTSNTSYQKYQFQLELTLIKDLHSLLIVVG